MITHYLKNKCIYRQLGGMKLSKQERFEATHRAELALYRNAVDYLNELKKNGEVITPKKWRTEVEALSKKKDAMYQRMRTMREDIKAVERLRRAAEQITTTDQGELQAHEPDDDIISRQNSTI